jgi:hypothetical protein
MSRIILTCISVLLVILAFTCTACTPSPASSREGSQRVAEEFVRLETTFRFDGIPETLEVTSTTSVGNGWKYTVEFDSRYAGYGNRSGKALAEVITHHVAEITVQAGLVTTAIMDGEWDMIKQRMDVEINPAPIDEIGDGFAIYLTKEDIPPAQMEALSHVNIAEQPMISIEDIVTYNAQTHEIELTDTAFERISHLEVPVRGKSFLVCVDKEPVYWGAFWTPLSSMSFDGVTIWQPLGSQELKVITFELGYPSPSFYGGEDPRNNVAIMKSLEQAGKLINKLSINEVDKLPHSLKGYELYSWEEDNQWHFTLITGTNRTKTMEEITSKEDFISESGWVNIHVAGADAIKDVLSRLPEGESVFWCDELHTGQLTETDVDLELPPEQIADAIKEHAEQCALDFAVTIRPSAG